MHGNDTFVPVILGTNLNTYNIARSLHEAFGVRSVALGRAALRETAHSRIVDVRVHRDLGTPEGIVRRLRDLAAELGTDRKLLLVPNIEFYTNAVIERRAELEDLYVVPLVGAELAARLMNKTDFYATCAELGVPHPETVVVAPAHPVAADLGEDLAFPYPVILKPSNTDTYPRVAFEGKQKVYLVDSPARLREIADRIFAAGYDDDLVVQEYLAGDEQVMRVANTYSDSRGRMRFCSVGQVVLTEYDPRAVGNNNAIVPIEDPELVESLRRLLDGVGYVGTANADVMVDRRTGTSKILEINLRQGATSYYTMAAGGNVARCLVDDLVLGEEIPETVVARERLWLNLPYPVVLALTPRALRPLVRRARRAGTVHTLRYAADRSLRRTLEIWRLDLRHALDHVRYARVRLNR